MSVKPIGFNSEMLSIFQVTTWLIQLKVALCLIESGRNVLLTVETRNQRDAQEKERELAEKIAEATVAQIRHKFEQDLDCLRSRLPTKQQQAVEAAKDAKYLTQRQQSLNCAKCRKLSLPVQDHYDIFV